MSNVTTQMHRIVYANSIGVYPVDDASFTQVRANLEQSATRIWRAGLEQMYEVIRSLPPDFGGCIGFAVWAAPEGSESCTHVPEEIFPDSAEGDK